MRIIERDERVFKRYDNARAAVDNLKATDQILPKAGDRGHPIRAAHSFVRGLYYIVVYLRYFIPLTRSRR